MADTDNSIATEGIPEITLTLTVMETVQAPVDATLSIAGEAADAKATGEAISAVSTTLTAAIAALFPIGSIYVSMSSTAPAFYGTSPLLSDELLLLEQPAMRSAAMSAIVVISLNERFIFLPSIMSFTHKTERGGRRSHEFSNS